MYTDGVTEATNAQEIFSENRLKITLNDKEIFIHEDCSVSNFRDFIESIKTKSLLLNENNFNIFYELSLKFEYYELQSKIEDFMKSRPDIQSIVNQLSEKKNHKKESFSLASYLIVRPLNSSFRNPFGIRKPLPGMGLQRPRNRRPWRGGSLIGMAVRQNSAGDPCWGSYWNFPDAIEHKTPGDDD